MKLIIIEGTDRTGKDTLVNRLVLENRNAIKRHWSFPQGNNNEEKTQYQKNSFSKEFHLYNDISSYNLDGIMVWNRAHLGEFVYGTIYRDSKPDTWVWELEKEWALDLDPNVYMILLYADPEFVAKKDDGKSYSAKIEDKKKEIDAFIGAFNKSSIRKKIMIKVNEADHYVNQEQIFQQVKSFINDQQS